MMEQDHIDKFRFLLGAWHLDYKIPESSFSKAGKDSGTGIFKKILDGKYVQFDYSTGSGGMAKGIFAWDGHNQQFRYYWFENSGTFQSATCSFINENTLSMNWHDSLFIQTFTGISPDKVILKMRYPSHQGKYLTVLEVLLTRKS